MLINANQLMGALDKLYATGLFNSTDDYNMVIKEINKLPNGLIRCSECKHYNHRCCLSFDGLTLPMADDFCSYAERRERKVKRCFDIPKEVAETLSEDTERRENNDKG